MERKRYNVHAVRDHRIRAGIPGPAMARIMGMRAANYYKKETGQLRWSLDEAKLIADYFHETVDSFFYSQKISKTE